MGVFHEVDGKQVWVGRKTYDKPNWPFASLAPGESFLIPMTNGVDATGRSESVIRSYVTRYSRQTITRHHVHRVEMGLLVIRSRKPHLRAK